MLVLFANAYQDSNKSFLTSIRPLLYIKRQRYHCISKERTFSRPQRDSTPQPLSSQRTTEPFRFTLKRVRVMIIKYSQMHRADKY